MKKVLIAVAVLFATSVSVQAQFKPTSGSITTEISFAPFGNSPMSVDGLNVRYFVSDNFAARVNLDFSSDVTIVENNGGDNNNPIQVVKQTETFFMFSPGIEYHLGNINRLSPYIGAEIGIGFNSDKTHTDNEGYVKGDYSKTKTPGMGFGGGVFTGFDFYIYEGLYLGAEFGFGYMAMSSKPTKREGSHGGQTDNIPENDYPKTKIKNMGFEANTAIRLGWRF